MFIMIDDCKINWSLIFLTDIFTEGFHQNQFVPKASVIFSISRSLNYLINYINAHFVVEAKSQLLSQIHKAYCHSPTQPNTTQVKVKM